MKKMIFFAVLLCLLLCCAGCGTGEKSENATERAAASESVQHSGENPVQTDNPYTVDTKISEVIHDPIFGEYGRLIFPVDNRYYNGSTLGELRLTWYNNMDPNKTV